MRIRPSWRGLRTGLFGRWVMFAATGFILAAPFTALAAEEIEDLRAQVKALLERIEDLEQRQHARAEPAAQVSWKDGFRIDYTDTQKNREYTFRFRTGIQGRYTYVNTDEGVAGNAENFSGFTMRRLRFFVDGTAPNRDWRYFMHVQLEPQSSVNTLDATVTWQRFRYAKIEFGRMKIPYSMEFWQSGFMQNGADRTIFTGDSEVDKDLFGNQLYDIPGGNARLRVGGHLDKNSGFPTGGMLLFRSQGISVNGRANLFDRKDFFVYWVGVFNGRDTVGSGHDSGDMLYSARVGLNFLPGSDPAGPMGRTGFDNYYMQGDYGYNTKPLAALVVAGFSRKDRIRKYYDPYGAEGNFGKAVSGVHDIENCGFDAALLYRYMGFSADLEWAWEEFVQDPDGGSLGMQETWDRWGARLNLGYFLVPKKWEAVFKAAYVERIENNTLATSLASGLGAVLLDDGYAVEGDLQQCRLGLNYYLHGFNQYVSVELGWLRREFERISAAEAAALEFSGVRSPDPDPQDDYRLRVQYQYIF